MIVSDLQALIDDLCGTDSVSYPSEDKLRHLNIAYGEVIGDILDVDPDFNFGGEIAISDLVNYENLSAGDNGYLGEYALPSDFKRWVRVEIKLDGKNFVKAQVYDIDQNPLSEVDINTLKAFGTSSTPRVDIYRNSMFVRPLPNQDVSGGLVLWYLSRQAALTTGAPAFDSDYHHLLAYKVARMRAISKPDVYSQTWKSSINNEIAVLTEKLQAQTAARLRRPMRLTTKKINYK